MKPIDRQQYMEVLPLKTAVENDLLGLPGVTGVDVGYKEVGGEQTDDMAILVFVGKKGEFDEGDRIPDRIHDVKTDVIEATFSPLIAPMPVTPAVDSERYDPLVGGGSTAPARYNNWYGSVGVPLLDKASGQPRVLSCWHVFCVDQNWQQLDRRITQPAVDQGGNPSNDTFGSVVKGTLGEVVIHLGYNWYVDCAIADASGRPTQPTIAHIGRLTGAAIPVLGELVIKYGATTGLTHGAIASTNFTTTTTYPWGQKITFYYQYRIAEPASGMPPFSAGGDSGSIVVDTNNNAVGLLFAASNSPSYSVANPMYMVLGALNVKLDTGS